MEVSVIDTPRLAPTTACHTAVIRLTVPRADIHTVMGPAMQEVIAAVGAQGATATGPLFSHHFRMQPDIFDLEVGMPVLEPFAPTGRVIAGTLAAGPAARAVYRGGYHRLGAAWGEFDAWLRSQSLRVAPDLVEHYVKGPESSPHADDWETELVRPLLE